MSRFYKLILPLALVLLAACAPSPTGPLPTAEVNPPQDTGIPQQNGEPTGQTVIALPTETPAETQPPTLPALTSPMPGAGSLPHLSAGQAITLTSLHMFTPDAGWGISGTDGASDHILKTQDGGNTWSDVTPPEPMPEAGVIRLATAHFQNPEAAWVTYYNSEPGPVPATTQVWITTDGGSTWQASQPVDLNGLVETYLPSNLQFTDLQNGWMLAHVGVGMNHDYVILFRSNDGGMTWQRLLDPYDDGGIQICQKTGMHFADAQHGWLTGDCGGVAPGVLLFRTEDGGTSWQDVTLPAPPEEPGLFGDQSVCGSYHPASVSPDQIRLIVQCRLYTSDPPAITSYFYTTEDSGTTWTPRPYPGGTLLVENEQNLLSLGTEIFRSDDGGKSWIRLSTVTWEGDFSFAGDVGWAVARSDGAVALVKTTDRGATWSILEPITSP